MGTLYKGLGARANSRACKRQQIRSTRKDMRIPCVFAFVAATVAEVADSERYYLADLDKYSKSQLGEETVVLRELFEKQGQVFVQGTFVELGALNGFDLSNTLTLQHALDWSGVLIEACPTHWPALARRALKKGLPGHRQQIVQTVQSAVCHPRPSGGTIPFSVYSRSDVIRALASKIMSCAATF